VKPPLFESDVRGSGFQQVGRYLLRALANGDRARARPPTGALRLPNVPIPAALACAP
jgi:hypothetical protein